MILKLKEKKQVLKPETVAEILHSILSSEQKLDQDKEHFWTIGLDTRNYIQYVDLVSLGSLNANLVHPREVFRLAVHKGIAQLIVAHNHPSGELEPSKEDLNITKRLIEAGKIIGIEVLDHIIFGRAQNEYISFKATKTIFN